MLEREQRERLVATIGEVVANDGYSNICEHALAARAGVPPGAVGRLFGGPLELLLGAHDLFVAEALRRVRRAPASRGGRPAPEEAIAAVAALAAEQPAQAYLALAGPEQAGTDAVLHSEQMLAPLAEPLREGLLGRGVDATWAHVCARGVIGGCAAVARERLQHGGSEAAAEGLLALQPWVRSYCGAAAPPTHNTRPVAETTHTAVALARLRAESRAPRVRLLRAVAKLSAGGGAAAVTPAGVGRLSGLGEAAFHAHFRDGHEALLACLDAATRHALGVVLESFQAAPTWPAAVRASVYTLVSLLASGPEFAEMAVLAAPAAGAEAREHLALRVEAFTAMIEPGFSLAAAPPARVTATALAGGVWALVRGELAAGRGVWLPALSTELTGFVLVPFLGSERALRVAAGAS
jgi:AcrR family transcriptional regulator